MVEAVAIGWGIRAAGWFISPYITKLLDKAYTHIKPSESRKKIRSLVTYTIPRLKLILEAAEDSEHKHLFEELLTDLKSAFYATEDILDEVEYVQRQQSGKKRKLNSSVDDGPSNLDIDTLSSLTIPGPLSNLLKESVTNIEKLIKVAHETIGCEKLRSNRGSDKHISNVTTKNMEMPTISDPIGEVTGREKVLEEITEMLRQTNDSKRLSVVGIIGIPGSGKTTLAQCMCESERNDSYFDLVMWIHVSEYFSVHSIFSEMFEQAWKKSGKDKRPQYNYSLDMLRTELMNALDDKRFLLVLDDIWFNKEVAGDEKLQQLLSPFKAGKRGSKVLVTSRQDSLSHLGPNVTSTKCQIPDLDDEDFLKLFMYYALNDKTVDKEDQGKLQTIGAQIAKKLKKSPLLARVVGGILFQKPTVEIRDWISVRDQNLLDKYMGALWWSYQHLGEQVRRCFAYCSIFPRTYRLRRDELVNLWVAEGFLNTTNEGEEMEDVGRGYFNELLSTSFLLPGGKDYHGEYFLIHDLLHDLAVKVAGSDCSKIENVWTGQISQDVRHLSIQSCNASMITEHIVELKKLRTLIICDCEHDITKQVLDKMFSKLSKLRVLIFGTKSGSCDYTFRFPETIGCLKHLRYLGLLTWGELTLPHTLDKLYLLQVLHLHCYGDLHFSFGEDMIKLVDLRHVIDCLHMRFPNIGKLTGLQTMPTLELERGEGYEIHQIKHLNKLSKLAIRGLEYVQSREEALEAKLADKERLTELKLSWDISGTENSLDLQADVSDALCPPAYIKCLIIRGYKSPRYPSWMVGTQKSTMYLHKLVLIDCSKPVTGPELFFITVSSLVLSGCDWDTIPYNMEGLTSLELVGSGTIPNNLAHLASLKSLIISRRGILTLPTVPRSLDYIEIIGCTIIRGRESWEKIKDVPHKVIYSSSFDDFDTEKFEVIRGGANPASQGSEVMRSAGRDGSSADLEWGGGGF